MTVKVHRFLKKIKNLVFLFMVVLLCVLLRLLQWRIQVSHVFFPKS